MTTSTRIASTALLLLASLGAMAQTNTALTVQRDVNQQTRIENGLKDGSLNVKEAGRLEKEEARVDKIQANALSDGKLSAAERQRLDQAQDKVSQDIRAAKTNDIKGNPNSASNQRMQADVQRNINQDTRIAQGVKSGELRNREVAKLERGQAQVHRREAAAAQNGHVSAAEQAKVQQHEDKQSERILNRKHNETKRNG